MSRVASTSRALTAPSTAPTSRASARPSSRVPTTAMPTPPTPPPPTASLALPPAPAAPPPLPAPVPLLPTVPAWLSLVLPPSSTPLLSSCKWVDQCLWRERKCAVFFISVGKIVDAESPTKQRFHFFVLHCCSHDNNSVFFMRKIRNLDFCPRKTSSTPSHRKGVSLFLTTYFITHTPHPCP